MPLTEASAFKDGSINTADIADDARTPVGTVITFAGDKPPVGYLKCNGDSINNGDTAINGNFINNTAIGTIDTSALYAIVGATLPDLRGEFIRGFDDGKGTDSGRTIRSSQTDQNKQHNHTASSTANSTSDVTDNGHFHTYTNRITNVNSDNDEANQGTGHALTTSNTSSVVTGITVATTTTVGTTINDDGGTEARPRNIALLVCIKY
tara:strand:+ start:238 stop:861 length:624 start_codon:yes stop_codon:yes gene_type:complete